MTRHQNLSLRKPESTSLLRSTGFNKSRVDEFFNNYKSVQQRYQFKPTRIYNLDETGQSTVIKPVRVVSTKGKKQVGQVASGERGESITVVGTICADGTYIPPIFIYPRIRDPSKYMINPPPGSVALGSKTGWINSELFIKVLQHIVLHTKCSKDDKILLLIDNHKSHSTIESIEFCRENGIVLLSFPPHTTHRLQPLDVGVFGPYKTRLSVVYNEWMLSNPGRPITISHLAELAGKVYFHSFTPMNIVNSFKKTGIWPIDSSVFSESDFLPSTVTDNDITAQTTPKKQKTPPHNGIGEKDSDEESLQEDTTELEQTNACSSSTLIDFDNPKPSTSKTLLETIRPFPKAQRQVKTVKRKRESKSKIYTDTPELLMIKQSMEKEKENKKKVKANKTVKRKVFSPKEKIIPHESSSESDISIDMADSDSSESFMSLKEMDNNEIIETNDFVLVKFEKQKNNVCFFIGQILEIDEESYQVKFLRRKGNSKSFHYPVIDDIAMIQASDIQAKLTRPEKAGTARTQSLFRFNYNFEGIDVR